MGVWNYDGLGLGLDECVELRWPGSGWVWVWMRVLDYDGLGLGLDECVEF